jgi:hypothetical protein
MKELPEGTGGKQALISTFKQYRRDGLLECKNFGKSMACIFFADKDSDDFTRKRLRSPHLIYSPTYDLEGHLFTCGDLRRALADACGITGDQAQQLVPDTKSWLLDAAINWRDWIALCLVSQAWRVNCGCTFDRTSQVNPDPLGAPDVAQVAAFKAILANTIGISPQALEQEYIKACRSVDQSINTGYPMRYFKGKWLSHLVQRYLESKPRIPESIITGVGDRLGLTLLSQVALHSNCGFSTVYSIPLQNLVARLQA